MLPTWRGWKLPGTSQSERVVSAVEKIADFSSFFALFFPFSTFAFNESSQLAFFVVGKSEVIILLKEKKVPPTGAVFCWVFLDSASEKFTTGEYGLICGANAFLQKCFLSISRNFTNWNRGFVHMPFKGLAWISHENCPIKSQCPSALSVRYGSQTTDDSTSSKKWSSGAIAFMVANF